MQTIPGTKTGRARGKRSVLRQVTLFLAAIAVFMTTYALILPAITMETPTYCGASEHVHTSTCFSPVLICGNEDAPAVALLSAPEQVLICPLEAHTHDETCLDGEGNLICGLEEHRHDDTCYRTVEPQPEQPAHVHTADCYEYVLICQETEHRHTLQCYSNPEADTDSTAWETAAERAIEHLSQRDRADTVKRVLAAAKALEGYTESQVNYYAPEEGTEQYGYTMFGAAYDAPYAPWNALYVDWVLQKAAVPGFPLAESPEAWLSILSDSDQSSGTAYLKDADPQVGDLVFIRTEAATAGSADVVGIINALTDKGIYVYQGDYTDKVDVTYYPMDAGQIVCYAALPTDPVPTEAPADAAEAAQTPVQTPDAQSAEPAPEPSTEIVAEETPTVTEAPADVVETPAVTEAPADVAETPAEPEETGENGDKTPWVFYTDAEEVSFAEEAAPEPETQEPEPERIVTADPDMIAAMQEVEQQRNQPGLLQQVTGFFSGLLGSGYANTITATVGDVTVVAEYNDGVLPENAAMAVTPVRPEGYAGLVAEAVGKQHTALLSYDITFLSGNEIVEPEGEVKISFRADFIEEAAEPEIVHIEADGNAARIEAAVTEGEISGVTDSFSVYVLSYTVDFAYGEYTYSLEGSGAVRLSELFRLLNIDADPAAVTGVTFSDESLLRLTEEGEDWVLESLMAFDTEETLTVTLPDGELVIYVTDEQIRGDMISDSGVYYEATVTYGPDARIPEGSTLKITEFASDSADYRTARRAVLADLQARDERVGFSDLSALDISILDPQGSEIEPAAPVQVDLTIKALPGVEDLYEVADTLTVRHHVETGSGVVVETVYDGGPAASFRMETDETVAAAGTAVDPESADTTGFEFSSFALYADGTAAPEPESEELEVSFETPVFSTFTVEWGDSGASNTTTTLRWRTGQDRSTVRAQLTVHYVDTNGNPISRPSGIDDRYNINNMGNGNFNNTVSINADTLARSIPEYTYQSAYTMVNGEKKTVTSVNATRSGPQYYYYSEYYTNEVTYYNNDTSVRTESGYWDELNGGDLYLVYEGEVSRPHATIHYVDEDGNELTVSNGQPSNDTTSGLNYLIYDVDGYEYAYTYRNENTNSNRITPILRYRNGTWRYTTGTNRNGTDYNSWNELSENDDIYVVYKPKPSVPQGGTPVPKVTGEKPDAPTITKESEVNGDGTNTLSLSVTGHTAIMEAEKLADVIVVFDVSGSMNEDMAGHDPGTWGYSGNSRFVNAKNATVALANSLLGKNTTDHPDLIRMSLITFSNTAEKKLDFTTSSSTFNSAVNNLPTPEGGTNWEDALQMANEMPVETDRATFVIFVTDGNPTFRQTRGVLNNGGTGNLGDNDVSNYYYAYNVYGVGSSDNHNRNYAAALAQAQSIKNHNKQFYTIGISNDVTNLTKLTTEAGAGADHSKTATSNDELVAAFNDIATSIIAHLGHSDIQITDGITELTQTVEKSALVNFEDDNFTYTKERKATQEEINDPSKIPAGARMENRDGTRYLVWDDWDPTEEGCAEAKYENGAVVWNLGETFMLEDGVTYRVHFKVWPSQEAYDLLAGLNNGIYEMDDENQVIRNAADDTEAFGESYYKQISGSYPTYYLKTNSDTSYTYREATKSGDTVTPGTQSPPGSFDDVDPLKLTTNPLKVQKQWHNNYVDSRSLTDSITMLLYGVDSDGETSHDFKTITLTDDYKMDEAGEHYVNKDGELLQYNEEEDRWETLDGKPSSRVSWYSENNFISYGLVTYDEDTNSNVRIYETGHDFTLRETDEEAHYYDLTAGVFRAMYINGEPTILERLDGPPAGMSGGVFHYWDGQNHYYQLDGHYYQSTNSDILIVATNSHRSYMDLRKEVVDDTGATAVDDTRFQYKVTFTVPEGIANYEDVEQFIWFSVYDTVANRTVSPDEYAHSGTIIPRQVDETLYGGEAYANYLVGISGEPVSLEIRQGWNVRFLNLPKDTTYSIEETNIPTGYDFVKAQVSGTRWIANMVDGVDTGSAVTMTGLPSNTSGDNADTTVTGTIGYANARYSTTYTNRTRTVPVHVLKTGQDGTTPLPGAEFSLYSEAGYAASPKSQLRNGLTSNGEGVVDLGKLTYGTYYLVETKAPAGYTLPEEPVTITVSEAGVSYHQAGNNLSDSGGGLIHTPDSELYTLTVTNNAGVELPHTGGVGTRLFYLFGSLLVLGALVILITRRITRK